MPMPMAVRSYFDKLDSPMKVVALALGDTVYRQGPNLKATLAWGVPCWSGHERVISIMAHSRHCNLQLWYGVQLAPHYIGRIEGSGKAMRHVKVRTIGDIDDEVIDIIDRSIQIDRELPIRVR